uniref:G-type lectin S-receptor-like serine/threonine-protein kinase At4g27290 n=1 Tax=Erigeron canadensis TaxID=72917 RepID=UPI001CB93B09|nr:G-type lectin S-receptor-like serine/threonine-protein kinase At4g27290 [Erigeron canadensis]
MAYRLLRRKVFATTFRINTSFDRNHCKSSSMGSKLSLSLLLTDKAPPESHLLCHQYHRKENQVEEHAKDRKYRYLGIWYNKISVCTPIWVANRETPIADKTGMLILSHEGNLIILADGGNTKIWSSNSTSLLAINNPVARIMDIGNLVLLDYSSANNNQNYPIWQSFDYMGDKFIAGMRLGKDLITGLEWSMTSWKSPDDPSPGQYVYWVDTNGYPQTFGRKGKDLRWRIGPWNGLGNSGLPSDTPNPFYTMDFVVNQEKIYYRFELKTSAIQRIYQLTWDGKLLQLQWIERRQQWVVYTDVGVDNFNRYAVCGPYGSNNINRRGLCSCLRGFEPRFPDEWEASDWSDGCQRKKPLDCASGDGFQKISGVKLPDTRHSWYNVSMTLGECEMACRRKCNCTAYANLDIRGSGCLLWFDELMDIREYDVKHNLYIRLAASEFAGNNISQFSYKRKKKVLAVVLLSIASAVLLVLLAVAYAYKKKKRPYVKQRGIWNAYDKKNSSVQMEDTDDDLPFLSLYEIAKATDNFSINNKIGEGGFGLVYKGVLEGGREVAVKRLSESSKQGHDEFKNEIMCIAKLQHRNLVKILGYCIHENEMILIYEYMVNKSLDSFLFDETRSSMLDWPRRFQIIHGMARAILYLHQDSRLQIIHRDLKAGNILLDADMNPKISDFGLARKFFGSDTTLTKTKKIVGTYGYISPEYAVHGKFSTKSDVFSFGVLVLEIVSGKKNTGFSHQDHSDNLLGHAWRLYKENRSIELTSASVRDSCIVSEVLRSIHVGLLCVQHHVEDRPTMMSVILMLISEGVLPEPKQPAFYTGERHGELQSVSSADEYMITQLFAR